MAVLPVSALMERAEIFYLPVIPIGAVPRHWWLGVTVICAIFMVLSWVTGILRFFTRYYFVSLGWDDWAMAIATIFFTVYNAGVISLELYVANKSELTNDMMTRMINLLLTTEVFYIWTMMALKLTLALFFYRLYSRLWQQRVVYAIAAICIVFSFAYFLFTVFQCGVPGADFWYKHIFGQCVSEASILGFGFSHGTLSAATDIILALMPIPMIAKAKISIREKAVVSAILVFAGVGCIASCVRVQYIRVLANNGLDFWSTIQPLALTSTLEPGIGIAAANLATMRPLLRRSVNYFRGYMNSHSSSHEPSKARPSRDGRTSYSKHSKSYGTEKTVATSDTEDRKLPPAFLFSATKGNSPMPTMNYDENRSSPVVYNPTSPLTPSEEFKSPPFSPLELPRLVISSQPPRIPTPHNINMYPLGNQSRDSSWGNLFRRSFQGRSLGFNSATGTQLATHQSIEGETGSEQSAPPEPVLEEGFRRWIIRNPRAPDPDPYTSRYWPRT